MNTSTNPAINMISYKGLAAAFFVATGRSTVERPRDVQDRGAQALDSLASELDRLTGDAWRGARNLALDAVNLTTRIELGRAGSYDVPSSRVLELTIAMAKIEVLQREFAALIDALAREQHADHDRAVDFAQMVKLLQVHTGPTEVERAGLEFSGTRDQVYDRAWLRQAADTLLLAMHWHSIVVYKYKAEAEENRIAYEKSIAAEEARKKAQKAAERAARNAERKAARVYPGGTR